MLVEIFAIGAIVTMLGRVVVSSWPNPSCVCFCLRGNLVIKAHPSSRRNPPIGFTRPVCNYVVVETCLAAGSTTLVTCE